MRFQCSQKSLGEASAQVSALFTWRERAPRGSAVHRMLAEGYLDRAPDPNDGRQARLKLTPRGRTLHEAIAARLVERQEEVLSGLEPKERRQLDGLLQKLALHAAGLLE